MSSILSSKCNNLSVNFYNIHAIIDTMISIALVLLENCFASSITGLIDAFEVSNAHSARLPKSQNSPIRWALVSEKAGEQIRTHGGLTLNSQKSYQDLNSFNIVYIPSIFYPGKKQFSYWLEQQQEIIKYLVKLHSQGKTIAANCSGTFLLAEAGLLIDKAATTAWWLKHQFKKRYPNVNLDSKQITTEQQNIICTGAMTSYHYLAMMLIEKYISPNVANLSAKTMLISRESMSQAPYVDLNIPIDSQDEIVTNVMYRLENNLDKRVDFSALSNDLEISQRTLIRRFKKTVGMTPLNYLQNLRIQHAKNLLTQDSLSVEEVMALVGYQDPSAFFRLFKQRTGVSPSHYRKAFK